MPTPPEPERPEPAPVLEPIRVLRPRRFDALAELMREIRPDPVTFEPVTTALSPRPAAVRGEPPTAEDDTQELPPAAPAGPASGARVPAPRLTRAAVAGAVAAAALVGFGCALLLPARQEAAATAHPSRPATGAPPAATPTATSSATAAADPDGPGTLRQGDTGPEVTELQERLLRIPDVYRDGSASGTYDAALTAAVARFQLWYGIRGDETGVYGDDTRRALESRTNPDDGS
ncbi:peptidoglycan-binding domain-containing protein [Streptomyces broussonetiae]|uniref:Peptidoglycan-binding protein n=1 Tax=Streptomyces broussonetiae TaxID=2686304 RepID=A0A6I6NKZ4_9ACTN|nr:peptidoglycan-binding domain-containing protein [Streptomyces broussonetiae]QHA08577.1 peptidoglycan-binding protein [Streptomyces broussonetiae]